MVRHCLPTPNVQRLPLLFVLLSLVAHIASAQLIETFADGDFSQNPTWVGDTNAFTIAAFGSDFALQSNGPAASDTLALATASTQTSGTWRFTFRYEGGRPSNFNQVRFYLMANTSALRGEVDGYYVQMGTNSRDIRLYRTTGSNRTLLGQSTADLFAEDERTSAMEVSRTGANWSVTLDGQEVIAIEESGVAIETSSFLGWWVKHSSTRGASFFVDDIETSPVSSDTTPPEVTSVQYDPELPAFVLAFSEPVLLSSLITANFSISPLTSFSIVPADGGSGPTTGVSLLTSGLSTGTYTIAAQNLSDAAGNLSALQSFEVDVVADTEPPQLASVTPILPNQLDVAFDEIVQGCDANLYALAPDLGVPTIPACIPEGSSSYRLAFPADFVPGVSYTLTVRNIADLAGNVLTTARASFEIPIKTIPLPQDLILNEFAYDLAASNEEFVELYNRSQTTFDLSTLTLADSRDVPVPLASQTVLLQPDAYVVLVRDSVAVSARFPGVTLLPLALPALNNSGDRLVHATEGGAIIDSLTYQPSWGGKGVALERIDPAGPSSTPVNWGDSTDPRGGTPGARNSLFAPDTTPPALTNVLPNASGDTLAVVFSEPINLTTVTPNDFSLSGPTGLLSFTVVPPANDTETSTLLLSLATPLAVGDYTLRVDSVTDFFGNEASDLSLDFSFFRPDIPLVADVVINEFFYTPPSGTPEFIELYNRSPRTFDLQQFSISDDRDNNTPLSDSQFLLSPSTYVVLTPDSAGLRAAFPRDYTVLEVDGFPSLNNSGDQVTLRYGTTGIDQVPYEPSWGGNGVALERIDPAGPSNTSSNWGDAIALLGATPGFENSIFAPDLTPPTVVFVDQSAPTILHVFFDEPVDAAALSSDSFAIDGTQVVDIQSADDASSLQLTFPSPIAPHAQLIVRNVRDLTGNTTSDQQQLPIAQQLRSSLLGELSPLVFNEIMYDPLADRDDGRIDQPEYLELFNTSDRPLSLRGAYWTDNPDEDGVADTTRLPTSFTALPPNGYAIIYADPNGISGDAAFSQSTLVAAFPYDYRDDGVLLLPLDATSLGLLNGGERIHLQGPDGSTMDDVTYAPSWHRDALSVTTGKSLERIAPTQPPVAPNWTTSFAEEGGTPGRPNSVRSEAIARTPQSGDLVFNEIMFAPLAADDDNQPNQVEYIELFNRASDAVSLNGLLLTDMPNEEGIADTLRLNIGPISLDPGGLATVFRVPSGTEDADREAVFLAAFPNATTSGAQAVLIPSRSLFSLPNANGLLRLHAPDTTTILDDVSYDDDWHHPNLVDTRGTALERISADGLSNDRTNWTSSVDASGGTPNQGNSVVFVPDESASAGVTVAPNPFSPDQDGFEDQVVIRYVLDSTPSLIRIRIFDANGRLVRDLTDAQLATQTGQVVWDGLDNDQRTLRIGIYIVYLEAVDATNGTTEAFKTPVVLARPLG